MKLTPLGPTDGALVDRFGGSPNRWADGTPWPVCGYCQTPMTFVVQLRGQALKGHAALGRAEWLQLFVCHSGEDCGFYDLRSKASHVALRQSLVAELAPAPTPAGKGQGRRSREDRLVSPRRIDFEPGEDDVDALNDYDDDVRHRRAHQAGFVDKLNGVPVAANQPEDVKCLTCAQPLRFLAQLLSADDWFIYYLHTCPNGHEVTFHAQRA